MCQTHLSIWDFSASYVIPGYLGSNFANNSYMTKLHCLSNAVSYNGYNNSGQQNTTFAFQHFTALYKERKQICFYFWVSFCSSPMLPGSQHISPSFLRVLAQSYCSLPSCCYCCLQCAGLDLPLLHRCTSLFCDISSYMSISGFHHLPCHLGLQLLCQSWHLSSLLPQQVVTPSCHFSLSNSIFSLLFPWLELLFRV